VGLGNPLAYHFGWTCCPLPRLVLRLGSNSLGQIEAAAHFSATPALSGYSSCSRFDVAASHRHYFYRSYSDRVTLHDVGATQDSDPANPAKHPQRQSLIACERLLETMVFCNTKKSRASTVCLKEETTSQPLFLTLSEIFIIQPWRRSTRRKPSSSSCPLPLVQCLVIDENRVLALECKREPPVPAHPHSPVPLQVALEWMQGPRRSPRVTHLYAVRVSHTKNRVATESLLVSS
jgi:hypothetical protein